MAVAWIAWRNSASVREHCAEYAEKCLYWIPGSWNVPINNGTEFARIDGYELKTLGQSTVCRLSLVESYLTSTKALPPTTKMTVAEAEKQLFAALAAGRITAVAKDSAGKVVDIPLREYPYVQLFEEAQADVLKHDALDHEPAFSEVRIQRDMLKQVWEEELVEPYMIQPMMRSEVAGYVPLCSALHWIMTEAGQQPRHLEDTKSWEAAVARLEPLMSTGEVQVIGRDMNGEPKTIDGTLFAGIKMGESISLWLSDVPWISCTPYVDADHWGRDFNDIMYLKKASPPAWTHLQVKKSDVLRHIIFASDANHAGHGDGGDIDKSGGQSFEAEDAILIEDMRTLILAGDAKSASAAAAMLAPKAKKLGSIESATERLRRAYGRKYPIRKRS